VPGAGVVAEEYWGMDRPRKMEMPTMKRLRIGVHVGELQEVQAYPAATSPNRMQ